MEILHCCLCVIVDADAAVDAVVVVAVFAAVADVVAGSDSNSVADVFDDDIVAVDDSDADADKVVVEKEFRCLG